MASSRQERMEQRMRGAARHQVEDESFRFDLPVAEDELAEESPAAAQLAPRSTPNTSAKRRRIDQRGNSVPGSENASGDGARRRSARQSGVYDFPDHTSEEGVQRQNERSSALRSSALRAAAQVHEEQDAPETGDGADDMEMLPPPARTSSRRKTQSRVSILSSPAGAMMTDEVGESPIDAPGSGRRRRVRVSDAAHSSSLLHQAVLEEVTSTGHIPSSSPLTRKSRKSEAVSLPQSARTSTRKSTRLSSSIVEDDEVDELSPEASRQSVLDVASEQTSRVAAVGTGEADELSFEDPPADEDERAEEIDDAETARHLGRRRPRRSAREPSPDLGSNVEMAAEVEAETEDTPRPAVRHSKARTTPAKQKQPQVKKNKAIQQPSKKKRGRATENEDGEENSGTVTITVQRFTKMPHYAESDTDADILNADIPFAKRDSVNTIDVLSQVCEELLNAYQAKLQAQAGEADDAAARRQSLTMLRALEAFQEELRTRLLEHAIALDALHALGKRVRGAQREKLALREEILRVRAEREQVALRMDAVRIKHEKDSAQAMRQIAISSAMHDVDLAVENGRAEEELSLAERKTAELANLELLISSVADQASSRSAGGGALKQIKEFNAFLERAAIALESR